MYLPYNLKPKLAQYTDVTQSYYKKFTPTPKT